MGIAGKPGEPDGPAKGLERSPRGSSLDARLRTCQMRFAAVHQDRENVGELREPARVAVVDVRPPLPDALPARLATLFDDEWMIDELFGKPTVAIIVTGGAQNFEMLPRVERVFREGLVKAAQMTNAWVFTGGMATGVMKVRTRAGEGKAG
jgi:hypothetical protein